MEEKAETMIPRNMQKLTQVQSGSSSRGDGSPCRLKVKRTSSEKVENDVAQEYGSEAEKVSRVYEESSREGSPRRKPDKQRGCRDKSNQMLSPSRREQETHDRPQELQNSQSTIMEQSKNQFSPKLDSSANSPKPRIPPSFTDTRQRSRFVWGTGQIQKQQAREQQELGEANKIPDLCQQRTTGKETVYNKSPRSPYPPLEAADFDARTKNVGIQAACSRQSGPCLPLTPELSKQQIIITTADVRECEDADGGATKKPVVR